MDLTDLTRHNLADHLRTEAGVDALAGRPPATRLVLFDRRVAVLAAEGRAPRVDEDWLEPMIELAYFARVMRPRGLSLSFPVRSDEPDGNVPPYPAPRFELRLLLAERTLGGCRVDHAVHPFRVSDDGLLVWDEPERPLMPFGLRVLAQSAMRRLPRRRQRRPDAVAGFLVAEGHRLQMAPPLADRLAAARTVTSRP